MNLLHEFMKKILIIGGSILTIIIIAFFGFLFLKQWGVVLSPEPQPMPVMPGAGGCQFDSFPGSCRISRIKHGLPPLPGEKDGVAIYYVYTPEKTNDPRVQKSYPLTGEEGLRLEDGDSSLGYKGSHFLEMFHITEGTSLQCRLNLETHGTCNPESISFDNSIDIQKYRSAMDELVFAQNNENYRAIQKIQDELYNFYQRQGHYPSNPTNTKEEFLLGLSDGVKYITNKGFVTSLQNNEQPIGEIPQYITIGSPRYQSGFSYKCTDTQCSSYRILFTINSAIPGLGVYTADGGGFEYMATSQGITPSSFALNMLFYNNVQ